MNKKNKRVFSSVLVGCMLLTLVPLHATSFLEETDSLDTRILGDEISKDNDDIEDVNNDNDESISNEELDFDADEHNDEELDNIEETDLQSETSHYYSSKSIESIENLNYYDKLKEYENSNFTIGRINNGIGSYTTQVGLYWGDGTKTISELQRANGNNADWWAQGFYLYTVVNQNGKYIITDIEYTENNYTTMSNKIPPEDGFMLLLCYAQNTGNNTFSDTPMREKAEKYLSIGQEIVLDFDYKEYTNYTGGNPKKTFNIMEKIEGQEKSVKNNNLETIDSVSTLNKVDIQLFNYDENINDKYLQDKKYPGFQNPGAAAILNPTYSLKHSGWSLLGDLILEDVNGAVKSGILGNGGQINSSSGNNPFLTSNTPAISNKIGKDGFPQLLDGTSIGYLFSQNLDDGVEKVSEDGLDGLFQYDTETHTYYFNSRENFAAYNKDTNRFELYDALLSPNYTTYLFGNFMPFENIQTAKKVSEIDRDYWVELLANIAFKKDSVTDSVKQGQYEKLYNWIIQYIEQADEYFGTTDWSYLDTINTTFEGLKFHYSDGEFVPITTEDLDFDKFYAVDFDDEKNMWFGMSQEINFYQPEDGMVGENNEYEMIYRFTGDDDFWLYIDGDLFIDLTGIHRHHGAEINFTKGTVTYYSTNINDDGDLIPTPTLTYKFSDIVSDKSKLNAKGTFKDISDYMNGNNTDFIEGYDEARVMQECSHNLKLFYMERGSGSGICRMNFNFPIIETHFEDTEINLNIEKEIVAEQDSFDKLALDKEEEYTFEIVLNEIMVVDGEEMLSGKKINGVVSNKNGFTISKIPAGKYIISENDSLYFDFFDFESLDNTGAITINKEDGKYILEIDSTKIIPGGTYYIKVKNILENERYYNKKYEIINLFK